MPRHIFIDLGANWGDTTDSYRFIAAPEMRAVTNWESYSFEASPLMHGFLDALIAWKNSDGGASSRPRYPCVLPAGSSGDRARFAPLVHCPLGVHSNFKWAGRDSLVSSQQCLDRAFAAPMRMLAPSPELLRPELLQRRLASAATPLDPTAQRPRYTFVPAAVGGDPGWLKMSGRAQPWITAEYLAGRPAKLVNPVAVPVVDVAEWISRHFSVDDYVVVKCDVEGAEFGILQSLQRRGHLALIDVLALECHSKGGNCTDLKAMLRRAGVRTLAESDWSGFRKTTGLAPSGREPPAWVRTVRQLYDDLRSEACIRFNMSMADWQTAARVYQRFPWLLGCSEPCLGNHSPSKPSSGGRATR